MVWINYTHLSKSLPFFTKLKYTPNISKRFKKLKALNLVRNLTLDKLKLHNLIPLSYKMGPKQRLHSFDELDDIPGDVQKDLKN